MGPGFPNDWNPPFRPALIYFTTRPTWCEWCGSFSAHSMRCPYVCRAPHPTLTLPVIGANGQTAYRIPLPCDREHHDDGEHHNSTFYAGAARWR